MAALVMVFAKTSSLFVGSPRRQESRAYNASPVSKPRSEAPRVLPAWTAPVVVIAGSLAMFAAAALFRGLGLRPLLLLSELFLMLPSLLALALARIPLRQGLALQPLPRREAVVCVALGVALWAASLGLFELQYTLWKPPAGYLEGFQRLHELLKPAGPFDALLSLAAIALAPALCEEVVFRGTALPALLRRLGPWLAALGSAALFGLIHVDAAGAAASFYRVPFAFTVGLGLAALRVRTGSLWSSILAHATLNGITFFVAPLTEPPTGELPAAEPLLGAALLTGGVLATALLFRLLPDSLTRERDAA
jgi:membrane protease YdiL (CAAX protease family)